jgi:hypothetical protein
MPPSGIARNVCVSAGFCPAGLRLSLPGGPPCAKRMRTVRNCFPARIGAVERYTPPEFSFGRPAPGARTPAKSEPERSDA